MDLAELHGNSNEANQCDNDEVKLSEKVAYWKITTFLINFPKVKKKSQELLIQLDERDDLVNSIQLKNRFIGESLCSCFRKRD